MQYKALVFDFFGVVFLGFTHFDHALLSYIQELRAQGIKVGLLSNAPSLMRQTLLAAGGVSRYFDAVVLSGDVGYPKPDPRSYGAVLAKLGTLPEDALMVDDHERNLVGARLVGMHGYLYTSLDALKAELDRQHEPVPTAEVSPPALTEELGSV